MSSIFSSLTFFSNNGNNVEWKAADGSAEMILQTPATLGTAGQVLQIGSVSSETLIFDWVTIGQSNQDLNSTDSVSFANLNLTGTGELRLEDTTGGENIALKAPGTVTSSYTITMPAAVGSAGQVLRTADGSGTLSWDTISLSDQDLNTSDSVSFANLNLTGTGELRLEDTTGGQNVAFKAPGTVTSSYTITMPAAVGSAGQVLRTADGSGTLSWDTISLSDQDLNTSDSVSFANLNLTGTGELRLEDTTGGENIALKAPGTVSSSYTITLPAAVGTTGQVLKASDGAGTLEWDTVALSDQSLNSTDSVSFANLNLTGTGELRLEDTTGGENIALKAPGTVSSSYTITLPAAVGSTGQVLRTTDGSGTLTWDTISLSDQDLNTSDSVIFANINLTGTGELRLEDTTGGENIAVKAPGTVSSSYTITLPDTVGSTGQVLKATDGAGNTEWGSVATVGGSTVVTANTTLTDSDPEIVQIDTSSAVDIKLPLAGTVGIKYSVASVYRKLNAKLNGAVDAIVFDSDDAYVAGEFTEVNGSTYNRIVKIAASTGAVTDIANCNGRVRTLLIEGLYLYAGGDFTSVNSNATEGIVRIELATPANKVYNTSLNTTSIYDMASDGTYLYIGGDFISGSGTTNFSTPYFNVNGDITTTEPTSLFPAITWTATRVRALAEDATYYYVGGEGITNINGTAFTTNGIARFNKSTYALDTTWTPDGINGTVYYFQIDTSNNYLYVAGTYSTIDSTSRQGLCRLKTNVTSSYVDATWDAAVGGSFGHVHTLLLSGSNLYVGGRYGSIGGQSRNHIARISTTTALADSWYPIINGGISSVWSMAEDTTNGILYFGGAYWTTINGVTCRGAGAVDTTDGITTTLSWDVFQTNGNIILGIILDIPNSQVYVCGNWSTINGGTSHPCLARVHYQTGVLDATWAQANSEVSSIFLDPNDTTRIFCGGFFTTIGTAAEAASKLCALNISGANDGKIDPDYNITANSTVRRVMVSGTNLIAGGEFSTVTAPNLAGNIDRLNLDLTDSNLYTSHPNPDGIIRSVVHDGGSSLFVAGEFETIDSLSRGRLAKLTAATGAADGTWNPNADGLVRQITLSTDLYVVGDFDNVGGQARKGAAKVSTTGAGTADASWNPNPDDSVYAVLVDATNSKVYLGGNFQTLGGEDRAYLGRVSSASTGAVDDYNPGANGIVRVFSDGASGDDLVYAGGNFTLINDLNKNYLVSLFKDVNIITQGSENILTNNEKVTTIPYYTSPEVLQIILLATDEWIVQRLRY